MTKRPTEEDLGIAPTAEEQEIASRPLQQAEDEDIRPEDDGDEASRHLVVAKPDKVEPESIEAKAARIRDETTGKFKAAEPAPKLEAGKLAPGTVDVRALQEARAENKVLMERMTTLLETVQKREAKAGKAEEPKEVIPDRNVDPLGYMEYMDKRLSKFEGASAAQDKQRQEIDAETAHVNEALAVAKPQFDAARAADPSLEPTYNALLESYAKELMFINRGNPEFLRDQRGFLGREMTKLENGHIRFAVAQGYNVAEYMRELAASRGIAAPQAQQPGAKVPAPQPGKTIAERQQAQSRHMSIGDLPGGAAPASISAKDLVKMTPKQFAEFAKKMGDAGLDELFSKA